MGHPAKEGLRHISVFVVLTRLKTQSGSSSKRGIKTFLVLSWSCGFNNPRVGHPAKEGLRL